MTEQSSRRLSRLIAGSIWGTLLVAALVWIYVQDLSIREIMRLVYEYVVDNPEIYMSLSM